MVSRLLTFLKSSETGPLAMIAGTILGQGAIMVALPVLSRMYTPDEFGEYANYMALFAILSLVVSLRYESAIPLPSVDDDSKILARLAGVLAMVVSILVAAVLFTVHSAGFQVFLSDAIIYLLPLSLIAIAFQKVFLYVNLRHGTYYLVAIMRGGQGLGIVASQIFGGLMGLSGVGLIQGHVAGVWLSILLVRRKMSSLGFLKRESKPSSGQSKWSEFLRLAHTYRKFPQYSIWADLANSAGTQLPILLFAYVYDAATTGIFFLAQRIGNAPATIVAESLGKAFLTRAVKSAENGTIAEATQRFVKSLIAIAIVPYTALILVLPQLLGWILGEQWDLVGNYLLLLSPWLLAVFLVAPLTVLYSVLQWQQEEFRFQFLLFIIRVSVLAAAVMALPIQYTIAIYSIVTAAIYLAFGVRIIIHTNASMRSIFRDVLEEVRAAFPIIILMALLHFVLKGFVGAAWQWIAMLVVLLLGMYFLLGYGKRLVVVYKASIQPIGDQ